ncbi:coatomer subunit zeta-1 isoform X2 [Colius striatus]|uniref:coatomer subunit zeta-1 isoform X2 n=1 Tax=Colius striatus TaxID=57412 RepID=UPI002B1E6E37|nr:coatomer subunit zeta-1 isoform X2 [Colius striatus]
MSALRWLPWKLSHRPSPLPGATGQSAGGRENAPRPRLKAAQRLVKREESSPNHAVGVVPLVLIGSGAANEKLRLFRLHVGSDGRKMEALILEPSLYTVKAVIILDNDGDRLFAKYYDDTYPSAKEQRCFEKNIFNKTHRTDSEIALLEGLTVVYKSSIDLYFYVIGSSYENELMLTAVLNCLFDSLSQMLRKNVEKRVLLENMEGLFLAMDEIVDGGVVLESDPQQVVHRVAGEDVPLTEQTVSQVLQSAKEQIKWSLLR